jgi:DNA helicase-2/ATP-dependent DNA helicase PcrA
MNNITVSPAEEAAQKALDRLYACIEKKKNFLLEAGAGAGKTYSLGKAITYLIAKRGVELLRQNQQIACITYTNVAKEEIINKTDGHPVIFSSTIHSFCWSLIRDFQSNLRKELPNLEGWPQLLEESGGIGTRRIDYDEFGHRAVRDNHVSLHHNDVLILTIRLMEYEKFRNHLTARFPILFIDEYQDTDKGIADAIKTHFIEENEGPMIGFFGDHWQKIYGTGCGKIEHSKLEFIGKEANFRSVPVIVETLNRIRPELPQHVKDPKAEGFVAIYHSNEWVGKRRKGQHWGGDLPADAVHEHLATVKKRLTNEGWDFTPSITKILMLTHNVLAMEQGYSNLAQVFKQNDSFIKKEDRHIAFFVEILEPVCTSYENRRYGEMFAVLGGRTPAIRSHADKEEWSRNMNKLLELRSTGTIGAVVDHLRKTRRPRLPDPVERKEQELEKQNKNQDAEESGSIARLKNLRNVSYKEVIALSRFIDEQTPFSTKHGVKGAEFENVLVVFGRGWGQYNFNEFLEWAGNQDSIPTGKSDKFERNRNLFYVVCSRPKKRLAALFTQGLTEKALKTLSNWFGDKAIHALRISS